MRLYRRHGTNHPTPETVDVLAEVCEYRAGKSIGHSTQAASAALYVANGRDDAEAREALVSLAAWAVARIELLDKAEI